MGLIKIIFALLLVTLLGGIYFFWEQERKLLPLELIHCGEAVKKNNLKYIALKKWLESNKAGWKNAPASYISANEFKASKMSIKVLEKIIVINYQLNGNEWTQVSKANNGLLLKSCN